MVEENQEVAARHGALPVGPAQHPDPGRSRRQGPLRGRHRRRDDPRRKRTPAATSASSIMEHKGDLHPQVVLEDASGKILDFYYLPEKAHIEVDEGHADLGRHAAGQDAPRGLRHAGHHRRSAPGDRNLRGPQAQGPGRDRRDRRHRRTPGRETPRQADHHRPQREPASNASTSSRTASTCASTPATSSGPARPWSTGRWCRTTSSASPAKRPCSST